MNAIRHGRELGQPRVRRHRLSIGGGGPPTPNPPNNITLPGLSASQTTLTYTPGTWSGSPPINVTARLWVDGVDVAAALPSMQIDDAWRGKPAFVRETAIGQTPGPVIADSATITVPTTSNLDQQVQAILAGTEGFVLDPFDLSTMFQDSAGTIPVTAPGQPVGLIHSKWGNTMRPFSQVTAASRPSLSDLGHLSYDGVDDRFELATPLPDPSRNAPAMFVCVRGTCKNVTPRNPIFGISVPTATQTRFYAFLDNAATPGVTGRRPDATTLPTRTFVSARLTLDVPATLSFLADVFSADTASVWKDGVASTPVAFASGAVGNFENTDAARMRIGVGLANNNDRYTGIMSRMVVLPRAPTPEERLVFEAWVEEAA